MTVDNIIKGMESFIKKQKELEAKRQLDIIPIRQKYEKEKEEYEKLSTDKKFTSGSYPYVPFELGVMSYNYQFAMSLKLLLQEILSNDTNAQEVKKE